MQVKVLRKITHEWQKAIFSSFWNLYDTDKQHFYAKTTEQVRMQTQGIKTSRVAVEGLTARNTDMKARKMLRFCWRTEMDRQSGVLQRKLKAGRNGP